MKGVVDQYVATVFCSVSLQQAKMDTTAPLPAALRQGSLRRTRGVLAQRFHSADLRSQIQTFASSFCSKGNN